MKCVAVYHDVGPNGDQSDEYKPDRSYPAINPGADLAL